MKIPLQRIAGNQAEMYVSYKLSRYCLVRPVASGTDIGIDLYCESVKENEPNIHFWIQVKGSEKNIKKLKNGKISYKFRTEHLKYWNNQPVPIFAFIIDNHNASDLTKCNIYIINLTEQIISGNFTESKTKTLYSDIFIDSDEKLENFILNDVEITAARQKLKEGIISPIPSSRFLYVNRYLPIGSSKFSPLIYRTIRTTVAFVLGDLIEIQKGDPNNQQVKQYRKLYTLILEAFKDTKHWEVPFNLGLSYKLDDRSIDAIEQFRRSKEILETDMNLDKDYTEWRKKILIVISDIIKELEGFNTG